MRGHNGNPVARGARAHVIEHLEPRRLLTGNTITGTVFNDANRNGARDAGETGVAGVNVNLALAAPGSVGVAKTDANGVYTFADLPDNPSGYRIIDVEPNHKLTTAFLLPISISGGNTVVKDIATAGFTTPSPYLDTTFGTGGTTVTAAGTGAIAIFRHSSGNLLAVGSTGLDRFTGNGAIDNSFGTGGTHPFGTEIAEAREAVLQSDGKVVVLGYDVNPDSPPFLDPHVVIARYNVDGSLDKSFNLTGVVNTGLVSNGGSNGITLGINGTIVFFVMTADGQFTLGRLLSTGKPDTSLGSNVSGQVSIQIAGLTSILGIAVQSDGKILASLYDTSGGFIARFGANGQLDTTFGSAGAVRMQKSPSGTELTGGPMLVLPSGQFLIASVGITNDMTLGRFSANGSRDTTFGAGGLAVAPFKTAIGGPARSFVDQIALDSFGDIVLAGGTYATSSSPSNPDLAVARFTANGVLDTRFGSGGLVNLPLSARDINGCAAIQPDGSIVVAGGGVYQATLDVELARLKSGIIVTPTGQIAGSVFNDANSNGALNPGEAGIAARKLFIDANKNGKLDTGEISTTTASNGSFAFKNLAAGTYRITDVLPTGWRRTAPSIGYFDVTLSASQSLSGKNFAETQNVLITGSIYNDANGNAKQDTGEKGFAARTVYIDKNKNGKLDIGEPSTLTAADGSYSFKTLVAGSYRLRQVLPAGSRVTNPAVGYYDLTFTAGQTATGKVFGDTTTALISGLVFKDANANAKQDAGELGLAGWVVYLDTNNNGKLDAGEKSFTTGADGKFTFAVPAGTYHLREVLKSSFTRTTPVGGLYTVTLTNGQAATGKIFGDK